jgi:hypothetical protein
VTASTTDPTIIINYGETGSGVTAGTAGIRIDRGLLPSYDLVFDESVGGVTMGGKPLATQPWVTPSLPAPAAIAFGSNAASFASNVASFGSNTAAYVTNAIPYASNAAVYASNAAVYASNAAVYGSNTASFSSNMVGYGSNVAFALQNARSFADVNASNVVSIGQGRYILELPNNSNALSISFPSTLTVGSRGEIVLKEQNTGAPRPLTVDSRMVFPWAEDGVAAASNASALTVSSASTGGVAIDRLSFFVPKANFLLGRYSRHLQ